ncbi:MULTISPECIES: hypothetical protein [Cytobacillus]|uniref:Uncharacterized protein n=1 Tax=Cytobacillus oceanisediminis TaxID=665099 RepID=A0ABX3CM85_9BACI|nr:hypothetical protein [Cytobacillus oceanisediminis]EFV74953.1 hypothetical protein HMPREF1013_04830 [Bacillus sp. 2_A_57_CT2]OHX44575.1 hypothetical protein BBV17_25460 [Cytobacillus oceanisediminis]
MERTEVILGTGDEHLDEFIKDDLEKTGQARVITKVATRRTLIHKVNELSPQLIVIGEDLIGESDSKSESEEEWEMVIEAIRQLSYKLRIVFICDRPVDDIFLTKLTTFNITDIFHEGKLPEGYIRQIMGEPSFKNIVKFRGKVEKVSKSLKEKKREEEEKQAETIIKTGAIPQEGKVVEVEVPVYQQLIIKPKIFVFGSAVKGSGSSTLAKMFAEYLANLQLQVGVLESPATKPVWYDLVNAEAYVKEGWISWHEAIQNDQEIRKGMSFNVDGVTYIIQNPKVQLSRWDIMKSAYLVGYTRQIPILIYDLSDGITDEREKIILRQANHIYLSTQFDPARVHATQNELVSYLYDQNLKDKVTMICNHSNEYLENKFSNDLKDAYDIETLFHIPHLEEVKNALMEGKSAWDYLDEDVVKFLSETFSEMTEDAIGKDLFNQLQPKKKKKSFLSIFRK